MPTRRKRTVKKLQPKAVAQPTPVKPRRITKKFTKRDLEFIDQCAHQYVQHLMGKVSRLEYHTWIHDDADAECIRGNLAIPNHMACNRWSKSIGRGVINGWCTVTGLPVGPLRGGCAINVKIANIPIFSTLVRKAYVEILRKSAGSWWQRRAVVQSNRCEGIQNHIAELTRKLYDKSVDPFPKDQNSGWAREVAKTWEMDRTLLDTIAASVAELATATEKFHQLRQRYSDEYYNWKAPSEKKITAALVAHKLSPEN
jgi:hypothetical protein